MTKAYFERRVSSARGTDSLAADIMRHMHARQHLGKVVIICDHPIVMLSACRKQWLKLSRTVQKQRAGTLNADKILKYTHTITRMQRMSFTSKPTMSVPDADVFCISPDHINTIPPHTLSIYLTTDLDTKQTTLLVNHLLPEALVIDYRHEAPWEEFKLKPKSVLEAQVKVQWAIVQEFFTKRGVVLDTLTQDDVPNIDCMDNALDLLLDASNKFLEIANNFHRALELARPLKIARPVRVEYDSLALLAHRVQALTPTAFTQRFLETYNEDDTFFLYDIGKNRYKGESLEETIMRHRKAKRFRLANALLLYRSSFNRL